MKRCSPWQVPRNQHRCCSPRVRCTPRGPDTVPCSSNPFLILLLRFLRPPVNPNFSKIKKKKRAIKLTIWTVDNLTKSSHHHCKWVRWKTHWKMISGTHNKWSTFYYTSGEIIINCMKMEAVEAKIKEKCFQILVAWAVVRTGWWCCRYGEHRTWTWSCRNLIYPIASCSTDAVSVCIWLFSFQFPITNKHHSNFINS